MARGKSKNSGAVVSKKRPIERYELRGNLTASTGSIANPFHYAARELDTDTNLCFYRVRYYDQNAGRFLREDPIHQFSEKSSYSYVSNNPLVLVDPTGLVARLYCEQIPSPRGGSWAQDLALAILELYHCHLYVSWHGMGHHLELYVPGPDDPKHERPHRDQPLNLSRAANSLEEPLKPPAHVVEAPPRRRLRHSSEPFL